MFKELGTPISLLSWMNRFVHDYLANHIIKLKDKEYPNGEYPHGVEGTLVGYKEIFGLEGDLDVLKRLKHLCGVEKLGRNVPCFCGSGKKYKRCYLLNLKEHCFNIPLQLLNKERVEIQNWLKLNHRI